MSTTFDRTEDRIPEDVVPPRIDATFRSWWINLAIAAGAGCCSVAFVWSFLSDPEGPSWAGAAVAAASGSVLVVRALRRGIRVTDQGITWRRLFHTPTVSWFRDLTVCPTAARGVTIVDCFGPRWVRRMRVGPNADVRAAVSAARGRWRTDDHDLEVPPARWSDARTALVVLVVLVGGLVVAGTTLDDARDDRAHYDARAEREVTTTADVVRWTLRQVDDGEEERTRTEVVLRFRTPDGTEYEQHLHWWGEHTRRSTTGVVYDPLDPFDVDLAERPNRAAQLRSADLRIVTSTFSMIVLIPAVLITVASLAWLTWRQRRARRAPAGDAPAFWDRRSGRDLGR